MNPIAGEEPIQPLVCTSPYPRGYRSPRLVLVGTALPSHAGIDTDVSITKTDGAVSVTAGTQVTYTITVNNGGPSPAQTMVTDRSPWSSRP